MGPSTTFNALRSTLRGRRARRVALGKPPPSVQWTGALGDSIPQKIAAKPDWTTFIFNLCRLTAQRLAKLH